MLAVVGCDAGPETAQVSGVVTFNGENVSRGTVTFYPVNGGRPSVGKIQPDGGYELSTLDPGDGALLGEYKVAVEAKDVVGSSPGPQSLEEEIAGGDFLGGRVVWLVPREYSSAESSGLTATVKSGDNKVDFELP